ncbi:MAG: DUF255 domain-containing protein [Planctomycetota bacterium]|nr:DUF255 domain-containing protein [Planctomycetota bacterium]
MSTAPQPPKHTNRLADQTSPYLLQHKHNPVDWHPWGPEAFEKARKEDKPIFLSVGYSSCHWCHVMERESFEQEDVGAFLNARFVCVKVDREERPDVDDIYMRYVHLSNGRGGWPMSVVLRADGAPFFGGTYYPKEAFVTLMGRLHQAWTEQRPKVDEVCQQIAQVLKQEAQGGWGEPERPLDGKTAARAVALLHEHFDFQEGGLQARMKFPPHAMLKFFLELLSRDPANARVREMTKLTLDKMQLGGIHDHVGGGFHRYATDPRWFLPHFEKMLYDNAQLAWVYSRAAAVLKDEAYARTARGIFEWILREMTTRDGVFYSAYDADSEGEEGRFYVWDRKELDALLGADAAAYAERYRISKDGNFHEEATGQPTGLNIPHLQEPVAEADARAFLEACNAKLRAARAKRVWPGLDDKVLTSWNALAIGAFARGGKDLREPRYVQAAARAAEWLLRNMRTPEGRWHATYNRGQAKLAAYLDDHAFLADAFLELHEATGDARWLREAEALVALLDEHFLDRKNGGYFFVADDHETLLVRMKNPADNATPSGNGVAAQVLVKLEALTRKPAYARRAETLFSAFAGLMDRQPFAAESLLLAWERSLAAGAAQPPPKAEIPPSKRQFGPAIAELLVGFEQLPAGAKVPVAVRIQLDEGWHVQSNAPTRDELVATSMRLEETAWASLRELKFPKPAELKLDPKLGLGEALQVYGGEVRILAELEVAETATPGAHVLQIELQFQACNDRSCERPVKARLASEVVVVPAGTAVTRKHESIFKTPPE